MSLSRLVTRNDLQNVLAHINLGDDAHQEITQAEFDALTQEEKDDGTIYFVTDGISGKVFLDDNTPIGTITSYGGDSDPTYWLICDGRAISRTAYAELFEVIGTTYGSGDGSTTFNIPDLRGNVAIGASATYDLGDSGGEATHTLTSSEIPRTPLDMAYYWKSNSTSGSNWGFTVDWGTSAPVQWAGDGKAYVRGGDTAHNNMQPYVVTNYIIKAYSTISEHQTQLDRFYPVGSYYETSDTTFDPNISWGGTWISEAAVSNEIVMGAPTITGANSGVYCNLSRLGKTVHFQFGVNFTLNLAASTITTVGTIPLGFRPAAEVTVGGCILGGTYGFVYLEPNGEIKLQRVNAGTGNLIRQNLVYFTSDDISVGLRWHRTA